MVTALSSADIFLVITITVDQKKHEQRAIETPIDISINPGLIIINIPTNPKIKAIVL